MGGLMGGGQPPLSPDPALKKEKARSWDFEPFGLFLGSAVSGPTNHLLLIRIVLKVGTTWVGLKSHCIRKNPSPLGVSLRRPAPCSTQYTPCISANEPRFPFPPLSLLNSTHKPSLVPLFSQASFHYFLLLFFIQVGVHGNAEYSFGIIF